MKKVSIKKLSILGMVLTVASAVTAAVLPSKSSNTVPPPNSDDNATLIANSGGGGSVAVVSCIAEIDPDDIQYSCHLTAVSSTGEANSEAVGHRTAGNTSNSDGTKVNFDTTSAVL